MGDLIFNCKNLKPFIDTIVAVVATRSYSYSKFYVCNVNGNKFLTKVMFYRIPAPELYGADNSELLPQAEAEIRILHALNRKIVTRGISPCVLEMIYHKICSTKHLTPDRNTCDQTAGKAVTPEEDVRNTFCRYRELQLAKLAHPKCAFVVLDICDLSFDMYLQKSLNTPISFSILRSLLFQILYTLHAIQTIFPGFKHNDLHTDNIMLKFDVSPMRLKNTYLKFQAGSETYHVPYFNMIPKLIDFGFSVMPSAGLISDIVIDRQMMFRRNNTPDHIELFHWIYNVTQASNRDKLPRVAEMLSTLEPSQCYITENYFQEVKKVKLVPVREMLRSPLFAEYVTSDVPPEDVIRSFACEM